MTCYHVCIMTTDHEDSYDTTWNCVSLSECLRLADSLAWQLFGDGPHWVNVVSV